MKKGKEIKIENQQKFNVVSGTVDNKNPTCLYIQISSWGKPKKQIDGSYENIIKKKSKRVKKKLFDILDEDVFYKKKSIIDFNMAHSGVNYDKKSFMSVEVTLFKKEPFLPINSKQMLPILVNISDKIIKDVFEIDEDFDFYKNKF